jgi:hypothetical protein
VCEEAPCEVGKGQAGKGKKDQCIKA